MAEEGTESQPTSGGSVEPEVLGTKDLEGVVAGGAAELRSVEGSDPQAATFPALSHNKIYAHGRAP